MTTSYWDNQEINRRFAGCATLRDIIDDLEEDYSRRGEVICEIRVNGMLLNEEDEAKFAQSPRKEIRDLSISTNRADRLILDALDSTRTFIPELEKSCLSTADALRGANIGQGQKFFAETLSGCQWLVDTLGHIRGAAAGIGQPIERTERWFEAEKMIVKVVREVSEAYKNNDNVLVADLLEYEMTATVQLWQEVLTAEHARRI